MQTGKLSPSFQRIIVGYLYESLIFSIPIGTYIIASLFFDDGREALVNTMQRITTNNVSIKKNVCLASVLFSSSRRPLSNRRLEWYPLNFVCFLFSISHASSSGTNFNHGTETRPHTRRFPGTLPRKVWYLPRRRIWRRCHPLPSKGYLRPSILEVFTTNFTE